MDPDAALARMRELIARERESFVETDATELSELIDGLDQWLSKGGFLPAAWRKSREGEST